MITIGRTSIDDSVKGYSWTKFKKMYEAAHPMRYELERKGYNLESAFKFLTGKKVPDVSKNKKSDKKD